MSAGQSKPKTEKWERARTKDLSASQLKRAQRVVGGGRMEKVTAKERKAAGKGVDIGTTKWMTAAERGGKGRGGLLVDASGKAVTGTVKLPSGQSAMYVRGKRVGVPRAGSAGTRAKTDSGGTTDKTTITPPPPPGARKFNVGPGRGAGISTPPKVLTVQQRAERSRAASRKRAIARRRGMVWDVQKMRWVMPTGGK
jgi:hypothetical protein